MKMRNLVMTTMALALAGNIAAVYAMPPADGANRPDGDQHGKLRHKVNRIFNAVDADGSDTITLDEWLAKLTEKARIHFDRIDSDDDNLISLDEFLAVGHGRGDGRGHDRGRDHDHEPDIDVDHDAVRACVADATGDDVPQRPDRETAFGEIDTNDDGFIDFDEFLAAKTERATNRFNTIDADSDGAITKQELAKELMQHRKHRRTVRDCVEDQRETDELLG
ncbi:MAG: EF-hand domain-containing protein [Proteobacteria bacterium]|nr:EF-hand domain-containing protein [Pseudomonadota bacterium]